MAWVGVPIAVHSRLILLLAVLSAIRNLIGGIHGSSIAPEVCDASGCTVSSTYRLWTDRVPCKMAEVVYPTTEEELIAAVAGAVKSNRKIKVASKGCHSIPKLVCPGGDQGLLISTRDYASNIIVDEEALTVAVDSGVQLRDLIDRLATYGLALPHSPYWDGLSIAGLLATGAHGSSIWGKGSAVHEYVTEISLVIPAPPEKGFAELITLNSQCDENALKAARVSLGVLGAVSQVTLKVEPMFKRAVTNTLEDDVGLEKIVSSFAHVHEFGDITWYPSQWKVAYRLDDRVADNVDGNGSYEYPGFTPGMPSAWIETRRVAGIQVEATRDSTVRCATARDQLNILTSMARGFKSNREPEFNGYPVVGQQNQMQAAGGCQNNPDLLCPWDPRFKVDFMYEASLYISFTKIENFISDVKALRDLDPASFCTLDMYTGILMRFVKGNSSAYLGQKEDAVNVDIVSYRPYEAETARLHEDVLEEIEQIAAFKYEGRPHWGKNRDVAFEGAAGKIPDLAKFLAVKDKLDPNALFSSEWSDAILGIQKPGARGVSTVKDFCAVEGLCICSEDRHCAPDKSYFCRPGKLYAEARVCRFEEDPEEGHVSQQSEANTLCSTVENFFEPAHFEATAESDV